MWFIHTFWTAVDSSKIVHLSFGSRSDEHYFQTKWWKSAGVEKENRCWRERGRKEWADKLGFVSLLLLVILLFECIWFYSNQWPVFLKKLYTCNGDGSNNIPPEWIISLELTWKRLGILREFVRVSNEASSCCSFTWLVLISSPCNPLAIFSFSY